MNKFLVVLFVFILTTSASADPMLEEAAAYVEKSFKLGGQERLNVLSHAAKCYEKYGRAHQLNNSALEYNLGTIYLMSEDYGRSIYHLKRAWAIEQDDQRIVNNLQRAGQLAGVDVMKRVKSENFVAILMDYWQGIEPRDWQWLILFSSWFLAIACAMSNNKKTLLIFSVMLLAMLSTAFCLRMEKFGVTSEVVLLDKYNPRAGMGEHYAETLQAPLKAGSTTLLARRESGWCEVLIDGNIRGWIPDRIAGIVDQDLD